MNNYIEYFTNYVARNYDMNSSLINLKYYHSLRVAYIITLLAQKLNMSDEDILLAFKLGLCHDLGRFREVILMGKFDNLKFDHGAYSNKVLYNDGFINYMDVDEHLLFRKAIFNHNKKDIDDKLNGREMVFANLLRDADKIDIMGIRTTRGIMDFDVTPTREVFDNYMNNQTIDISDIKGTTDSTILYLSFFKDLYYRASHDLIKDFDYLNQFLKKIRVDDSKKEIFNSLIEKNNEERGKIYVR